MGPCTDLKESHMPLGPGAKAEPVEEKAPPPPPPAEQLPLDEEDDEETPSW